MSDWKPPADAKPVEGWKPPQDAVVVDPKPQASTPMTTPLPGAAAGPSIGSGMQQAALQGGAPLQQPSFDAALQQPAPVDFSQRGTDPLASHPSTPEMPEALDPLNRKRAELFRGYASIRDKERAARQEHSTMLANQRNYRDMGMAGGSDELNKRLGFASDQASTYSDIKKQHTDYFNEQLDRSVEEEVDKDVNSLTMDRQGLPVADPVKVREKAERFAAKYGLGKDQEFIKDVQNRMDSRVQAGVLKPRVDKLFDEERKKIVGEEGDKVWKGFTTDSVEYAHATETISDLQKQASAGAKADADAIYARTSAAAGAITEQWKSQEAEALKAADAVKAQFDAGQLDANTANQLLAQVDEKYQSEYAEYSRAVKAEQDAYITDLNKVNSRYNERFAEQQKSILKDANARVQEAAARHLKEYEGSPEAEATRQKLNAAYEKAWRTAAQERGRAEGIAADIRYNLASSALGPTAAMSGRFIESTVAGLGGAFKGIATTLGSENGYVLGQEMERAFLLPEARSKEFADLIDPANVSQLSGQLLGGMAPSLAAAAAVSGATGGAGTPVAAQLVASSLAAWGAETLDISGRMKDDVFRDTRDMDKANDAAWKSFRSQVQLLPTYAFEGLPFVKGFLKAVPTRALRAGTGATIEYGTEVLQEVPQNIAEKRIKAGKDPWDGFAEELDRQSKSGELRSTLIGMAPITLLGGAGQLTETSGKQDMLNAAKSYAAKAKVDQISASGGQQWMNGMVKARGEKFARAVISSMYTGGSIDEATAKKFIGFVDENRAINGEAKALNIPGVHHDAYVAFSADYADLSAKAEAETSPLAKAVLTQRANEAKKAATEIAAGSGEYVTVKYPDGTTTVLAPSQAAKLFADEEFLSTAAITSFGNNGLTFTANGEKSMTMLGDFQERSMERLEEIKQGKREYLADAKADREAKANTTKPTAPAYAPPPLPAPPSINIVPPAPTGGAKAPTATASAQPAKKETTSKAVESVFSADEATGEEETPAAPTGVPEGGEPVSSKAATTTKSDEEPDRIPTRGRIDSGDKAPDKGAAAGQDVRLSKAKIEAEAKRLGYLSARSFNTQNTLNENPSPEVAALLHAISEHRKLVIGKKEIRDLVSMDGEDFGLWAKTHEPARDGTGNLVREEEIPLAVLRIQALRDRGMNKLADTEEQQLRLSKKKENWTIDEWKSRHDEEISQGEVDEKNKEAESFNAELKKAQDKLVDGGEPVSTEAAQPITNEDQLAPEAPAAAQAEDTGAAPGVPVAEQQAPSKSALKREAEAQQTSIPTGGAEVAARKELWQMTRAEASNAVTSKIPVPQRTPQHETLKAIRDKSNRSGYLPEAITPERIAPLRADGLVSRSEANPKLTEEGSAFLRRAEHDFRDETLSHASTSDKASDAALDNHRSAVEKAVADGKPVPAEVLDEYAGIIAVNKKGPNSNTYKQGKLIATGAQAGARDKAAAQQTRIPTEKEPWQMTRDEFLDAATLDKEFRNQYAGRSSRTNPSETPIPKIGSWRISKSAGWNKYGDNIEQLREIPIDKIRGAEDPKQEGRQFDVERYAQFMQDGKKPPPISAAEIGDGTFRINDGHRRLAAHEIVGKKTILAWVSPSSDTGLREPSGKVIETDLTHQTAVKNALAEGNPVPAEVLADYPELKPQTPAQAEAPLPKKEETTYEAKARKAAAALERAKLKPDQLYALPLPPSVWNGAIRAMQEVIIAGGKAVDAIAAAIKHIQASDWWKNKATQKEKEEVTSHLQGRISDLETALAAEDVASLKENIQQAKATGAQNVRTKQQDARKEFMQTVKDALKPLHGRMTPAQVKFITAAAAKVNPASPKSVSRFERVAAKAMAKANYADDLSKAKQAQKRAKKLAKQADVPLNHREALKAIAKVDVGMLNDPAEFTGPVLDYLQQFGAIGKSYQPGSSEAIIDAMGKLQEQTMAEYRNMLLEEFGVEAGSVDPQQLYDALESDDFDAFAKNLEESKRKEVADAIRQVADYSKMGLESYENDDLSATEKKTLDTLRSIDIDLLSTDQQKDYIKTADNITLNDAFYGAGRMEAVAKATEGLAAAEKAVKSTPLRKVWTTPLKEMYQQQFASVSGMFRFLFGQGEGMAKFHDAIGMTDLILGKKKVDDAVSNAGEKMADFYTGLRKKYKDADTDTMRAAEGIAAYVLQPIPNIGLEESFALRKQQVADSIAAKSERTKRQDEAEVEQRAFDLVLNEATTRDELIRAMKAKAPSAWASVEFLANQVLAPHSKEVLEHRENFWNEAVDVDNPMYLPISYRFLTSAQIAEDAPGQFGAAEKLRKPKESANLIKRESVKTLPKDRVIDMNIRRNTLNALERNLYDTYTSPAWQRMREFFRLPAASKVVGGLDNSDFMQSRLNDLRSAQMREGSKADNLERAVSAITNTVRKAASQIALGGFTQAIKQPADQLTSAMVNVGPEWVGKSIMEVNKAEPLLQLTSIGDRGELIGGTNWDNTLEAETAAMARALKGNKMERFEAATESYRRLLMAALTKSDVLSARTAWLAYYQKYLADKGIEVSNWQQEADMVKEGDPVRRQALAFAEVNADITQGSSDPTKQAKLGQRSPQAWANLLKAAFNPFSSFTIGMRERIINDASDLMFYGGRQMYDTDGKRTKEGDRAATAGRSLAATLASNIMFTVAKVYIAKSLIALGAEGIRAAFAAAAGDDDDDKQKGMAMMSLMMNILYTMRLMDADVYRMFSTAYRDEKKESKMSESKKLDAEQEKALRNAKNAYTSIMQSMLVSGFSPFAENALVDGVNWGSYMMQGAMGELPTTKSTGAPMKYDYWVKQPEYPPLYRYGQGYHESNYGVFSVILDRASELQEQAKDAAGFGKASGPSVESPDDAKKRIEAMAKAAAQ